MHISSVCCGRILVKNPLTEEDRKVDFSKAMTYPSVCSKHMIVIVGTSNTPSRDNNESQRSTYGLRLE